MKAVIPTVLLSASVFMSAQSGARDLDLRIQAGAEKTRPYQSVLHSSQDIGVIKAQPDYQIAPTIRMLGELPGAPGFYYSLGGKLESTSNFLLNENGIDMREVEVAYSYFSFGASCILNTRIGFSLGFHLEGRIERIITSGTLYEYDENNQITSSGILEGKISYLRPWGRVSMDFTFNNSGRVRPFIGIEGAYPITRREQRVSWNKVESQDSNLMEAIAPRGSVGCYIGFRF